MARSKRAQVLMEPEEYALLEQIAADKQVSVAELIRTAVQERYLRLVPDRKALLQQMLAHSGFDLPDWDELSTDIEGMYSDGFVG